MLKAGIIPFMYARWGRLVDALRTGFWFVPMIMLMLAGGLALLLLHVDLLVDPGMKGSLSWAYNGGAEGARSLLSTIAGSMITAASVTFSLAAVALSLASQQYGSRVLRNFMRDGVTQVLLGTFVATFLYCVLVVRSVRGSSIGGGFVPAISVTVAIALSLASLVMLIYFIHHIVSSIQASQIVRVIAEDLARAIPRLYPSQTGKPLWDGGELQKIEGRGETSLSVSTDGYVQNLELDTLLKIATEQDLTLQIVIKPGDHVLAGAEVARVWGTPKLPEQARKSMVDAFILGGERTPAQDIRYQFMQLTDVVIRALSPGINDPYTAINGIDELTTGAAALARRSKVADKRRDEHGALRLIVPTTSIDEVLEQTVGHIAIYAAGDSFVMAGLHHLLSVVEPDLHEERQMATLARLHNELSRREKARSVA